MCTVHIAVLFCLGIKGSRGKQGQKGKAGINGKQGSPGSNATCILGIRRNLIGM